MLENAKLKCNIGLTLFWPLKLGSILVIAIGYFLVEVNQVRMFIFKTQISSYLSKTALFLAKPPHFTGLQNRDHVLKKTNLKIKGKHSKTKNMGLLKMQ